MFKSNKAQAALEFLTTYGWAFLVILIMIGTLAYFGVLSPSKVLPNRCTFGAEFQCVDYVIASNAFRIRLKNGVGEAVVVDSVAASTESSTSYTCTGQPTLPSNWKAGEIVEFAWTTCSGGGLSSGSKGKVLTSITYHSAASTSTYAKNISGEVYATVG